MSNDYAFLSKSAAETKETIQWEDGNEYPLVKVEVSHKSHPFYTGKAQFVDTAGRIDKFRQKYGPTRKTRKLMPSRASQSYKEPAYAGSFFVPEPVQRRQLEGLVKRFNPRYMRP